MSARTASIQPSRPLTQPAIRAATTNGSAHFGPRGTSADACPTERKWTAVATASHVTWRRHSRYRFMRRRPPPTPRRNLHATSHHLAPTGDSRGAVRSRDGRDRVEHPVAGPGRRPRQSLTTFAPRLVTVDTPTRADKARLQALGLDLTEHAGHDYVEVVLHTAVDREALRAAGFTWDVRIPDLLAREAEINRLDDLFAATRLRTALPSGRDAYRSLADYNSEMKAMAEANPGLVKLLTLPEKTLDGRTVFGVEIAKDVAARDGRPTFAMFGVHHAREWPSGEHAMEFAVDLVKGARAGDPRISGLLERGRMVVVPVVNPDGFHLSFTDGQLVDLREVDGGGTATDPRDARERVQAQELPRRRRTGHPGRHVRRRSAPPAPAATSSAPTSTATTAGCGVARAPRTCSPTRPTAAPSRSLSPRPATCASSSRRARSR